MQNEELERLAALKSAHPAVREWLLVPTDRTRHAARVAAGVLSSARVSSRRFYAPETGYASVSGPNIDLCLCREPIAVTVHERHFRAVLERAANDRVGLVLVAPSYGDETLATIAVNAERKSITGVALEADLGGIDELARRFGSAPAMSEGLRAERVHLDEVLATANGAAFLAPGGGPIGIVSVGGATNARMWASFRAMSEGGATGS